ncbi:putative inactive acireductone dioxygenase [Dirofilaria immitis]
MRSWQMERYPCGDRRLPHHIYPPKIYTNDQLQALTGVISYVVDVDDTNAMKKRISRIKAERKMSTSDILTLHENMNDFERKLEQFYEPVAKNVDSVFLVMDGSAYYDIEVDEDNWIRINVERGDLIIIPRGHNYRFTLTTENKVVIERFFDADTNTQQG